MERTKWNERRDVLKRIAQEDKEGAEGDREGWERNEARCIEESDEEGDEEQEEEEEE